LVPGEDKQELSVFRINGMEWNEIWEMGRRELRIKPPMRLHGGAVFKAASIPTPLFLQMDESPERHGNIIGWPSPYDESLWLSLAQRLAAKATLNLTPEILAELHH
jgi:hypothetical protein